MRRFCSILAVALLYTFLFSNSSLLAGGLESAKAGATRTKDVAQTVVDRALQPGTFTFVEQLVDMVGNGIDWYFDRLVVAADAGNVPEVTNSLVSGLSKGLEDFRIVEFKDRGLNAVEDIGRKLWMEDFKKQILEGTQVEIKPYFKSKAEYNTNTFMEPHIAQDGTKEDVVWTWTPGVSVNVPFGDAKQHRIGAVYEARVTNFTKYDDHDDLGQSVGAVANLQLTDSIYVNATEEFVKDAARAGTLHAKRVEYSDQKVSPTVGYNWRDWTTEVQWENNLRRYYSHSLYDIFQYNNNVLTGRVYRTLAPDFRALVEYNYSHYDYPYDTTRPGRYH